MPVEPDLFGGVLPGRLEDRLGAPAEEHWRYREHRQEGEPGVEVDEDAGGDRGLEQQAGELEYPFERPGAGEQSRPDQVDVVGDLRIIEVLDAGRAVYRLDELDPQPGFLELSELEVVEVGKVAAHQLGDEQDRGDHREDEGGTAAVTEDVVDEVGESQRGEGRGDITGEHERDGPQQAASVETPPEGDEEARRGQDLHAWDPITSTSSSASCSAKRLACSANSSA